METPGDLWVHLLGIYIQEKLLILRNFKLGEEALFVQHQFTATVVTSANTCTATVFQLFAVSCHSEAGVADGGVFATKRAVTSCDSEGLRWAG